MFDAKRLPLKEDSAVSIRNEMTIMYAIDHDDADALIEQLILKNSTPKKLTVVSSDHRIQKAALRRKATPIDSGVWYDQLERPGNQTAIGANSAGYRDEKPELKQLADVDWASEFGLDKPPDTTEATAESGEKPSTFNPFPPGYADDLLDNLTDEDH